ncbi:MAG: outer membrane protein assembly factor BamD, partial [Pseudomonadota bacterium]
MILSRLSTAFLLLAVLGLALPGCTLLPEQKDKTKNWSAQRFYSEASAALRNKDYEEAIEYYEKLEARYPFGQYTMQAKLDLAYAYYKDEQNEAALETCDRFIQLHPTSPYVAYAYYLKGVVNFNRPVSFLERFVPTDTSQRDPGSAADAYRDFGEVVNRYPDSVYAKDARRRMVFLRN